MKFNTGGTGTKLFIASDGKVGIGTEIPNYKTTIAADGINASLNLKRTNTSVNGQAYGNIFYTTETGQNVVLIRGVRESSNADGAFTISTKTTSGTLDERFRINSGGNLQLGSSVDAGNTLRYLDIYNLNTGGSAGSIIRFITRKSDGSSSVSADIVKYKTGGLYINNNEVLGTTGFISFSTGTAGGSVTERLRIHSGGLVEAKARSAEVRRMILSGSPTNSAFNIEAHDGETGTSSGDVQGKLGLFYNDGSTLTNTANISFERGSGASDGAMAFITNQTERLRIDSSGRVLISGQNVLSSTSLTHRLQVKSQSDAHAIAIIGRDGDDIGELTFFEADKSTRLGEIQYRQDHVNFRHRVGDIRFATGGATERLRITTDGQLRVQGTYNGSSSTSNSFPVLNVTNLQGSYTAGNIFGGVTFGKVAGHSNGIRAGMLALYLSLIHI